MNMVTPDELVPYLKTHVFYVAMILGGIGFSGAWLQEHDLRLAADYAVKEQQATVASLKSQIATTQQQAAQKVQVVTRVVHDAVTPSQVVAAIPSVSSLPLATRVVPNDPVDVEVAAQPLMQLAGEAKTNGIELQACQEVSGLKDKQLAAKDTEIAALKKKPKFLTRLKNYAEAIGAGVVIGALLVK